jgi:hypothetical protein
MQQKQKPAAAPRRRGRKDPVVAGLRGRATERALQAANAYAVRHYPFGCLGNNARRLVGDTDLWIVPIFLTSPGCGAVGEVGLVAVDAQTCQVVGATERHEVNRLITHLKETKRDDLEAAFHQARTV